MIVADTAPATDPKPPAAFCTGLITPSPSMSPTTASLSLFSCTRRPAMRSPKRQRGFLALPGEIRNHIYTYCFDRDCHCEILARGSQLKEQKSRTVKLRSGLASWRGKTLELGAQSNDIPPTVVRFSRPLGKYNVVHGLQTNWLSSLYALSLVCKQVYLETAIFVYSKTVFVFDAPKRMHSFFGTVSSVSLQQITKLHLHYDTYGPPERIDHQVWQERHRQSWIKVCKVASKQLVGLQELQVWVQLHDSAPKFNLREKWIQPLLQFRRLTTSQQLQRNDHSGTAEASLRPVTLQTVEIHVRTRLSRNPLAMFLNNHKLSRASTELHLLYGHAVSLAIRGAREEEAMAAFNAAWEGKHKRWNHHLQFARTGW
ncbi:hypothetical protein yc1106_02637 [Curvularia clavata]|uniref:DUF7730 domain-containing protein n=1 Tax=Curvularia clavata TaxID=95742 RepID=A0A9Q8Z7M5_CURCL|nr:hypothetical protein yc1106_02637 [Curvularia clavata]